MSYPIYPEPEQKYPEDEKIETDFLTGKVVIDSTNKGKDVKYTIKK